MLAPLLTLTLSLADPFGFPATHGATPRPAEQGSTGPHPSALGPESLSRSALGDSPSGEGLRPSPPAAGPLPTSNQPLTLPASAPSLSGLAIPAVALALLAVVTLILARRRRVEGRLIRVLETTSLGPRRALVVAQLGDELMVIGSSEAGLQLLAARRAGELAPAQPAEAVPLRAVPDAHPEGAPARHHPLAAALGRLGLRTGWGAARADQAAPAGDGPDLPAFDALLAESAEDLELRRKLARGQAGSVR